MDIEENDEKQLLEINDNKLIKTEPKGCEPFHDSQFLSTNDIHSINIPTVKQEIIDNIPISDDIKVEVDEYFVYPETSRIEDFRENGNNTTDVKCENVIVKCKKTKRPTKKDFRPYKCPKCSYAANRKQCLTQHLKIHNKDEVEKFYCDQCNYSTIYKFSLTKHKLIHERIKPYMCQICQLDFNEKHYYTIHMNKYHPELVSEKMKLLKCKYCPFETLNRSVLTSHKRKHGDVEQLAKHSCSICGFSSYYRSSIKTHYFLKHVQIDKSLGEKDKVLCNEEKIVCNKEKPFRCKYCDYGSYWNDTLKRHMKRTHENPDSRYKCLECNYLTNNKGYYNRHLLTSHGQKRDEKFFCDQCDYNSAHKRKLMRHFQALHKPVQCQLCRKYFTRKIDIEAHEKNHHPDKCLFITVDNQFFKNHTHVGQERTCLVCEYFNEHLPQSYTQRYVGKFFCDQCDYAASDKRYLVNHFQSSHKTVQCNLCQKYFTRKSDIEAHQIKHYPTACHFVTVDKDFLKIYKPKKDLDTETADNKIVKHVCTECDYFSFHLGNLKNHYLIHIGEKPFTCDMCEFRCREKSSLIRHVKNIHKNQNMDVQIVTMPQDTETI